MHLRRCKAAIRFRQARQHRRVKPIDIAEMPMQSAFLTFLKINTGDRVRALAPPRRSAGACLRDHGKWGRRRRIHVSLSGKAVFFAAL
jgi:hypothetical protein